MYPHLDRLAQQGTYFRQFYASSPVCSPSRCGIMTGQYPFDNGPEPQHGDEGTYHCVGSTAGLRGTKGSLYEGGVRVPLIVSLPGRVPAGRVDFDALMSNVDFMPTLASVCGCEIPEEHCCDGEDVSDAWYGNIYNRQKPIIWEFHFGHGYTIFPKYAVRKGNYVLLQVNNGEMEMYDTSRDWSQVDNVAAREKENFEELYKILKTIPKQSTFQER